MIGPAVEDHQVHGAMAVQVQEFHHPGIAGGVWYPLGLGKDSGRCLVDEDQVVLGQQDDVVAAILVQVANGQRSRRLDRVATGDLLAAAEPAGALVEQDLDLGGRSVINQVGFAVAVEVSGCQADDFLVDGHARQPHSLVKLQVIDFFAERPRLGLVARPLRAQEQVDARASVVADDDVARPVAVQVANHQVADPPLELVDLQRLETEVIGELGGVGQRLGRSAPGEHEAAASDEKNRMKPPHALTSHHSSHSANCGKPWCGPSLLALAFARLAYASGDPATRRGARAGQEKAAAHLPAGGPLWTARLIRSSASNGSWRGLGRVLS